MSLSRPSDAASVLLGTPHSRALLEGIALQLTVFAEDTENFGQMLCSDGEVASRHLVALQQIDRLAQSLREMAMVLKADKPDMAVAAIRLGELRDALEKYHAG